jgi:hypothetical protein
VSHVEGRLAPGLDALDALKSVFLHQEWLGNAHHYEAMWKRWEEGDVRGARAALSDETCDRLYIHGSPDFCRARIQDYFDAGLDTAILGLIEEAMPPREQIRLLAPE